MFIDILRFCYDKIDNISKTVLKIYCYISVALILIIVLSVLFYKRIFFDYTTAVYWINDFLLLGVNMTKALVIPVLFYEIMRTYFNLH